MFCIKKITQDITWLGANDRRLALFENTFPLTRGVSYNAYLINDDKTVLLDTVDKAVSGRFFDNLAAALNGRALDYVVVNHMEPDHGATLAELVLRYPQVKIVCNTKTVSMIKQFFDFDIDSRALLVREGDTLETGRHKLSFINAPMVHWPEVMVTYDATDKVLFSADAFGSFGAINGNLFADEVNFEADWLSEARRYYTNIVGKYGVQVLGLLEKAKGLDIQIICPLHGLVWRENLPYIIDRYVTWASFTPEEQGVVIAFASIYGNTENAAELLASRLGDAGVKNIAMYDCSSTHPSYILSDCFRFSHLVFAASTYNGGLFPTMETLLLDIRAHGLKNRTIAYMENGTWAAQSGKFMRELCSGLKNITELEGGVSFKSSLKAAHMESLDALAESITESLKI